METLRKLSPKSFLSLLKASNQLLALMLLSGELSRIRPNKPLQKTLRFHAGFPGEVNRNELFQNKQRLLQINGLFLRLNISRFDDAHLHMQFE